MAEADAAVEQTPGTRPEDQQGGPGRTSIAPRVVERLAVAAAREVDASVTARDGLGGLVRGGRLPSASAVVAGRTARLRVEVAATWPAGLATTAAHVRDHVGERVSTLAGVEVTAVDVTVAEVVRRHGSLDARRTSSGRRNLA